MLASQQKPHFQHPLFPPLLGGQQVLQDTPTVSFSKLVTTPVTRTVVLTEMLPVEGMQLSV